ncbi:MAG: leucine-rich repeat domain-containing protein [Clostridia bacterium]|nr:leucine-rich repeat domain-containing protein [Clostridia bacterium]
MKAIRIPALITAVMLLCACCPPALAASGERYTSGDFIYVLEYGGTANLVDYRGAGGEITIPDELDGHPVTASESPFINLINADIPFTLKVGSEHPNLETVDGVLIIKTSRTVICCPPSLNLSEFGIPQGIRQIGGSAFYFCEDLTGITIPDSVTDIGAGAFHACRRLTDVTLPPHLSGIGPWAFYGCALTRVTVPDGITCIEGYTFSDCRRLADVGLPDTLRKICGWAFENCVSLTALSIPDSVTEIEGDAFDGCRNLASVTVSDKNPAYAVADGVLFNRSMTLLLMYPAGKPEKTYTVPDSVTGIGGGAFNNCANLESITIPDTVNVIEKKAFLNCDGLTSMTLPQGITRVAFWAFYSCGKLESVIIPDSVTYIDQFAFSNCVRLQTVRIPASVTRIDFKAFDNCPDLVVLAPAGSYAEQWCRSEGKRFQADP